MGDKSAIEWTDATWNPTTGCTRVSEGCRHCYIERTPPFRIAGRRFLLDGEPSGEPGATTGVALHPDRLDQPLRWRRPRRVFVNSLSDLFHADVPRESIAQVFAVMALTPQHTYQVLTKRPGRMRGLLAGDNVYEALSFARQVFLEAHRLKWGAPAHIDVWASAWPLPNVWLGVSVEDQETADKRIPVLLETSAAVRFLSCEPLLGPVDIARYVPRAEIIGGDGLVHYRVPVNHKILTEQLPELRRKCPDTGYHSRPEAQPDPYLHPGPFVDWLIVGGESGPGAQPMHPDWARSLRDQCVSAGVPFFFKQVGEWAWSESTTDWTHSVMPDGSVRTRTETLHGLTPLHPWRGIHRAGKKAAGREIDGRTWDQMPEVARG